MASGNTGLTAGGGDPRRPSVVSIAGRSINVGPGTAFSRAQKRQEKDVSFEEFVHYAIISRADHRFEELNPDYKLFGVTLKKNNRRGQALTEVLGGEVVAPNSAIEKKEFGSDAEHGGAASPNGSDISPEEYVTASRALRTAGWGSIMILILTDILGPFNLPQGMAYMGYGPGSALFTLFGFLAGYAGFMIWRLFLGLDSDRYPIRIFGDLAFRVYGRWARIVCNIMQALQLFLNVGIIVVQIGLGLDQVITGSGRPPFCFVLLVFFMAVAGMLLGQVRTLKNIGWIGNISVFLNVITMIIIMAVVPRSEPNYDAAITINGPILGFDSIEPIVTNAGKPAGTDFFVQVEGLQLAIGAYGGAIMFAELLAEMRRPFDFWKGMITAQLFIYFFYMFFAIFVYSFQGQYAISPANQSISPYGFQTACNIMQIVTGLVAALLYGNIGLKVIYSSIFMDLFGFPALSTRAGKLIWVVLIPIYWGLAFVIGAAIPQIANLASLMSALCVIQFSYTFPPIIYAGFLIKRDAMLPGDGFDPATGQVVRQDGGIKRWIRGFKKHAVLNGWHILFFLGSLVTCVLGLYAAIKGMIAAYATGAQSSFSCTSPFG